MGKLGIAVLFFSILSIWIYFRCQIELLKIELLKIKSDLIRNQTDFYKMKSGFDILLDHLAGTKGH